MVNELADTRAALLASDRTAALLTFERAVLVAAADRIARAPSLRVKMLLCRWVWETACRVRRLAAVPAALCDDASDGTPGPHTRRLMRAWQALASEDAFLVALRDVIAPLAIHAYAGVVDAHRTRAAELRRAAGDRPMPVTTAAIAEHALTSWRRLAHVDGIVDPIRGSIERRRPDASQTVRDLEQLRA